MDQFVGQILLAGFNFSPVDWVACDGRLLPIDQFQALFTLIGTTYGGDGQTSFAVPDLRGRTAIGMGQLQGGSNYIIGSPGGTENVTITSQTYPNHTHTLNATSKSGGALTPSNSILASGQNIYRANEAPVEVMNQSMCGFSGGSQPHSNLQPFLVANWIIALFGVFPSQS